jgi:hypothetical protein
MTFLNNIVKDVTDSFIAPTQGNLHLKSTAIKAVDMGLVLSEVTEDFDGQKRGAKPDIGADELIN